MFNILQLKYKAKAKFGDFMKEEDGLATVEVVVLLVILVGIAILFRQQIYKLVQSLFDLIGKVMNNDDKADIRDKKTTTD